MTQKQLIKYLKDNGYEFEVKGNKTIIKGPLYLSGCTGLTTLPDGLEVDGNLYLRGCTGLIIQPFLKRWNVPIINEKVILYKRVSEDFLTQEGTDHETHWAIGSTLTHPDWRPESDECVAGKFHACARPTWCNSFRSNKGDRYIAVEVAVEDLYEWTDNPQYPQKIGFRKGTVLYECDKMGVKIE
jgi:hypothetical protein